MKRWSLAAAGLLAVIIFAVYLFFFSPEKNSQQLKLWYVSSEFSSQALEQLAEKYNSQRSSEEYRLSLRAFDTEDELAAAYGNRSYPDLLLCSYSRAASLGEREQLQQLDGLSFSYISQLQSALPYAGSSFFPLGSSVPVLVYSNELPAAPATELSEFLFQAQAYYLATSDPFFTADAVLPALSNWTASLGYELKGDLAEDDLNQDFCSVYNAMAEQVMVGSFMPPADDVMELVSQSIVPCAIVASSKALDLPENLSVAALPMPKGSEDVYVPEIWGLAVTSTNSYAVGSCRAFALWLMSSYTAEDALKLGLVPVTSNAVAATSTELDSILMDVYTKTPAVYSPLGEYMEKREEMEAQVCHALDLLY